MRRAAELFAIDEWGSDSRFVEKAWTSRSEPEPAFISVAVSRSRDRPELTHRLGPARRPGAGRPAHRLAGEQAPSSLIATTLPVRG